MVSTLDKTVLTSACKDLANAIHAATESIYAYQKSVTAHDDVNVIFKEIRSRFKKEWEEILELLQSSYGFGQEVVLLKGFLGGETADDMVAFLGEVSSDATDLKSGSKTLVDTAVKTAKAFPDLISRVSKVIGDKETSHGYHYSNPDPKALLSTQEALNRIHISLNNIHKFWVATEVEFQAFVRSGGALSLPPSRAASLEKEWTDNNADLMKTCHSVVRSCDEIVVHGIGVQVPPSDRLERWFEAFSDLAREALLKLRSARRSV